MEEKTAAVQQSATALKQSEDKFAVANKAFVSFLSQQKRNLK